MLEGHSVGTYLKAVVYLLGLGRSMTMFDNKSPRRPVMDHLQIYRGYIKRSVDILNH
jgi:hypothetical protein